MQVENIKFISTSHIATESVEEIREAFEEYKPDIVAVELDPQRLQSLMMDQRTSHPPTLIAKVGLLGYLFALIGSFMQRKLGSVVGTKPGEEMLAAVNLSRANEAELHLIDQNVEVTLKKLSNQVPFSEKMKVLWELLTGFFQNDRERLDIDLDKVPKEEIIEKLSAELEEKFPHIYNVLVEQRNVIMVNNLEAISRQNPESKILAVIGAGHTKEMVELLEDRFEEK